MKKIMFGFVALLLVFGMAACGDSTNSEKPKKEKRVEKKELKKEKIDFSVEKKKYKTDKNGYVTIRGNVTPGSSVEVDFDKAKVDDQGNVSFKTKLDKDTNKKEFNIEASNKDYISKTIYVTVLNKSIDRKSHLKKVKYEKKHTASNDTVYGKLTNTEELTKETDELYKDEKNDIMYSVVENDEIYQVSIGLGDDSFFEISKDKNHLIELARDYMEKDATLVQTISDQSFIYKSPKLNKKYNVDFEVNDDNKVFEVLITHYVPQ